MAARPQKRRRDGDDGAEADDEGNVDLGSAEHAWWAQRTTEQIWAARAEPPPVDRLPRDILADHFGPDWRTSFGFDPPPAEPAGQSDADPEPKPEATAAPEVDPYAVLGVAEAATWAEIVVAHRALARAHHPDLAAQRPEPERLAAEDHIRALNIAYQQLRVRRGR